MLCIYNSRNSFGLLAYNAMLRTLEIYNSRNSFGLLAHLEIETGQFKGSTIVEIHLAY